MFEIACNFPSKKHTLQIFVYLLSENQRDREQEWERSFIHCLSPQTPAAAGAGPGWGQMPGTPLLSLRWAAGTQALGSASAATFLGACAEHWIRSGGAGTQTCTLIWAVGVPSEKFGRPSLWKIPLHSHWFTLCPFALPKALMPAVRFRPGKH